MFSKDQEHYSEQANKVVREAIQLAQASHLSTIHLAHLLAGIIKHPSQVVSFLFHSNDVDAQKLYQETEQLIQSYPKGKGGEKIYLSSEASKALARAKDISQTFEDPFVAPEHFLLSLLESGTRVAYLLKQQGLDKEEIHKTIKGFFKVAKGEGLNYAGRQEALDLYAINLNKQAKEGKIDPVIGRLEEIRCVVEVLSRRTKNNPVLVGEPGVGKTAIAEGLAQQIVEKDVPENMRNKTIMSLDMGALIAGAKYQGEFEQRLKKVIKEVTDASQQIILFVDEIHTLIGTGGLGGTLDAANLLKPALARGDLHMIGATTLAEYQKHIEKDRALERRFQPIIIEEPTVADATTILRGIKKRYELHHGVEIKDNAIVAAVNYAHRYISDRFLPDKAIDLIDQTCAKLRIAIDSMPEELDSATRAIRQLEIEREAMRQEKNQDAVDKLTAKIESTQTAHRALKEKWEQEKALIQRTKHAKETLALLEKEALEFERQADYGKVAEIRYGKIPEIEKTLQEFYKQAETLRKKGTLLKEEVTADDILEIVSKMTNIPVGKIVQSEKDKLLQLERHLGEWVIGQPQAVSAVANAVRRSRAGIQNPNRPIASFICIGTTGVGKTELAKASANILFNDPKALVRIDLSEYQERHTVSRLIGAPPGYVGYEEGGQLTEAIRRKPYAVLLLDEMEKAHPDVFNLLLQVLDEGHLTDNKGRVVNFKNTLIIMTTNLGAHLIQDILQGFDAESADAKMAECQDKVLALLKKTVPPEFLNRIDDTIVFRPINQQMLKKIVLVKVKALQERLAKEDVLFTVDDHVIDYLAEAGYQPQFGARPLERVIQHTLLNELSKALLAGKVRKQTPYKVILQTPQKLAFVPCNQIDQKAPQPHKSSS